MPEQMSLDSKPKNSTSVWLCLMFDIIQNIQVCPGLLLPSSLKKRIDLCVEKLQKSIDWLIGEPLITNSSLAQDLMGNAV